MYSRHEEYSGLLNTSLEAAFDHLDDQRRLSAHMSRRSWKMGWGRMDVTMDRRSGREVGSHIVVDGRVFGMRLHLDEVVTERVRPALKRWETVGEPRLLVIGAYRMGFDLKRRDAMTSLKVGIDYELPRRGLSRVLGRLFGRSYATWCTRRMVLDAQATFPNDSGARTGLHPWP